jgi:diguanylate cyclase
MRPSDPADLDRSRPWRRVPAPAEAVAQAAVALAAVALAAVALLTGGPWAAAVAVLGGAAGWYALRRRAELAWSERAWRQLELLSPELVGQLDERSILRVALADSSALLRADAVQVRLHGRAGAAPLVATQCRLRSEDVELSTDGDVLGAGADVVDISLPGPGPELGRLVVQGGPGRHRRTRRHLAHGLAHLIASSLAAERMYERHRTLADDLYRAALRDDLTELGNRTLLQERGSQLLARSMAQQKWAALLLIDLDDFKRVNDTLGHRAGDRLLAEVGARIRSQIRDTDLAVRLGGDEFVILAGELAAPDDAELLAERLLAAIAEPLRIDVIELQLSGSLGIAIHGEDADSLEGLVAVADQAMYQAKGAGRARWRRRVRLPSGAHHFLDARSGVPEDQLELHHQPQVTVDGERVVGVEVLPRWRHPELGLLPLEEFLPELEHRGLDDRFTTGVLERALADLPLLRERVPGATVSLKLSARDLLRRDLVPTVEQTLAAHGASGADLVLEMIEASELSSSLDGVLEGLGALGCAVSIHEFGTGRSSLATLASHPTIAEVKLAPRLVSTVLTDERAMRVVRASVDCARGLGLRVVAEGVESADVAKALAGLGCDRLQGGWLGESGPAQAALARLQPAPTPSR